MAPPKIIQFWKTASPPPKKKKHRDPTVCRNVPPPVTFSAPIGRSAGRRSTSLVRCMALKPNPELYEEATDKNKR